MNEPSLKVMPKNSASAGKSATDALVSGPRAVIIVLPPEAVITISQLLTATEVKVPARSLWVCQIISTKDELADLSSNTNSMLSPVGKAESPDQLANLRAARAFAASTSRFLGGALVCSEASSLLEAAAISSTAAKKATSLALDGWLKPLILRTYCNAAARTSSSFTGGSKLNRGLMFRHICCSHGWALSKRSIRHEARNPIVSVNGYCGN